MSAIWFHITDTIYGVTLVSYGIAPGVVGVGLTMLPQFYARYVVSALMLSATIHGVLGSAHHYDRYLLGCAVFAILCTISLFARARRSKTSVLALLPYDLIVFVVGTAVTSLFYETPMM